MEGTERKQLGRLDDGADCYQEDCRPRRSPTAASSSPSPPSGASPASSTSSWASPDSSSTSSTRLASSFSPIPFALSLIAACCLISAATAVGTIPTTTVVAARSAHTPVFVPPPPPSRRFPPRGERELGELVLPVPPPAAAAYAVAFGRSGRMSGTINRGRGGNGRHTAATTTTTALGSAPRGGRPQPRRMLKKRPRRREKGGRVIQQVTKEEEEKKLWEMSELRPLTKAKAIEAGLDYWMDDTDLQKSKEREQAFRNRKAAEGEISKERLRTEVVAPYTQNWIGWFSVGIVMIATIVTQFPELLQSPVIPIPDL